MGKSYIITATCVAGRKFIKISGLTPLGDKREEVKEREDEFFLKFPGFKQTTVPGQGGQGGGDGSSESILPEEAQTSDYFYEIPQMPGADTDNTLPTLLIQRIMDHFAENCRAFSVSSAPITTVSPISHLWTLMVSY